MFFKKLFGNVFTFWSYHFYVYEEVITESIRPIDLAIKVTIFTSLYSLTVFKKYITYFFLCHLKVYKTYNFYKNA